MYKVKKRIRTSQVILNVIIVLLFIMALYPLAMALWSSFKSPAQYASNKWLPTFPLRSENIGMAYDKVDGYMLKTVIVALLTTALMLVVSTMAAFSISKLNFIGSKFMFALILAVNMVPGVLTLVPVVMLYHNLGLNDTIWALVLPGTFSTSTVFLLVSSYKGIPNSMFEAAEIDGAGDFKKYTLIGLPLVLPIIATLAIMQISGTWSDFGWPMLIMTKENYTIAAGLKAEFYDNTTDMPVTFAAYLIASIPLILLFFFTNRVYVEGIVSSGIKL